MKRKNGFVFMETIVVVSILSVTLLLLFSTYSYMLRKSRTKVTYDTTENIYKTYFAKSIVESSGYGSTLDDKLISLGCTKVNNNYSALVCDIKNVDSTSKLYPLKYSYDVDKIYYVSTSEVREHKDLMASFDATTIDYFKYLSLTVNDKLFVVKYDINGEIYHSSSESSKYRVSFNPMGGVVNVFNATVVKDLPYGPLPEATRDGYSFTGWFTLSSGGTRIYEDTIVTNPSSHTLYAHWNPNDYEITFDPRGGNVPFYTKTVTHGEVYGTLPTPTKNGYTFDSWYIDESFQTKINSDSTVKIINDQTLYAGYTNNAYKVTFDPAGGTVEPKTKNVVYGNRYEDLPVPERFGYTFAGWYNDKNIRIYSSTTVGATQDHTLIAHWTANPVTVNLNPNGGTLDTTSVTLEYDSPYSNLPTPTRRGYTFAGWSLEDGTIVNSSTLVKNYLEHTLTAEWNLIQYEVQFNPNGGKITTFTEKQVNFTERYGVLATATRTGYNFTGWYTEPDGGIMIRPTTTYNETHDQVLYAHWEPITYHVTIVTRDASSSTSILDVRYGESNTLVITPEEGTYLSDVTCTNGYTTNANTDNDEDVPQTITIYNNYKVGDATCTFETTPQKVPTAYEVLYDGRKPNVGEELDYLYDMLH